MGVLFFIGFIVSIFEICDSASKFVLLAVFPPTDSFRRIDQLKEGW